MVGIDKLSYVGVPFYNLKSESDIQRVIHTLREIGYMGVDFKDTCFNTSVHSLNEMLLMAVRAAEKEGMTVPCSIRLRDFCSPDAWQKNASEFCEFIRMSADAGIPLVNSWIGGPMPRVQKEWFTPSRRNDQKGWDALKGSLEMIARVAEDCGVHVALESVVGQLAHDYFTTREMFRMADSPCLCLTMDPSHYHFYDNDIPWTVRQWGCEKIKHVHLKDAVGMITGDGCGTKITPLLGEGHIDWPGFFAACDDIGYEGWYSVEFESWVLSSRISAEEAARLSYQAAVSLIQSYKSSLKA